MIAELIAFIVVLFFAKWTLQEYKSPEVARLIEVRAELELKHDTLKSVGAAKAEINEVVREFNAAGSELSEAREASVMADILKAPAAVFTTGADTSERRALISAWSTFGTGFYVVALDMIFVGIFLLFSIVMAMAKGKKKEEPVRRSSRKSAGATEEATDA